MSQLLPKFKQFLSQLPRRRFLLGIGALMISLCTGNRDNNPILAQTKPMNPSKADKIFRNGTILTMDDDNRQVSDSDRRWADYSRRQ